MVTSWPRLMTPNRTEWLGRTTIDARASREQVTFGPYLAVIRPWASTSARVYDQNRSDGVVSGRRGT